jgi:predicted dehydrogenase
MLATMGESVRIGFVGLGEVVRRRHIPVLRRLDGVELAAIANRRPESTASTAAELGIGTTFADWRQLVEWDGVDAVWCGTYPDLHRRVTEAALAAGKHVFCEARMAATLGDALAMHRAAQDAQRTTVVSPYPRYERGGATVMRLLSEGAIGRPYHVLVTSFSDWFADPDQPLHWRQRASTFGRNMVDLGQQLEVLQRWMGQPVRVTAVAGYAVATRYDTEHLAPRAVERPDTLTAVAELSNGAHATFVLSAVAHHGGNLRAVRIFGSEGAIHYEAADDRIWLGRAGSPDLQPVAVRPEDEPGAGVEERFIAAIRAGSTDAGSVSFADGVRYMETTEAFARSAESGGAVDLPLDARADGR